MPNEGALNVLSAGHLTTILEERFTSLEEKISIRLSTHAKGEEIGREVQGVLTDVKRQLIRRIKAIEDDGITNTQDQESFCGKVDVIVGDARERVIRGLKSKRKQVTTDIAALMRDELETARSQIECTVKLPTKAAPAPLVVTGTILEAAGRLKVSVNQLESTIVQYFVDRIKDYLLPNFFEVILDESGFGSRISLQQKTALHQMLVALVRDCTLDLRKLIQPTTTISALKTELLSILEISKYEEWKALLGEKAFVSFEYWVIAPLRTEIARTTDIGTWSKDPRPRAIESLSVRDIDKILRPEADRASYPFSKEEKQYLATSLKERPEEDFHKHSKALNREFHGFADVRTEANLRTFVEENREELELLASPPFTTEEDEFLTELLSGQFQAKGQDARTCEAHLNSPTGTAEADKWAAHLNKVFHQGALVRSAKGILQHCKEEILYVVYGEEPYSKKNEPEAEKATSLDLEMAKLIGRVKAILGAPQRETMIRKFLQSFVELFDRYGKIAAPAQLRIYINLLKNLLDEGHIADRAEMKGSAVDLANAFLKATEHLVVAGAETTQELTPIMEYIGDLDAQISKVAADIKGSTAKNWEAQSAAITAEIDTLEQSIDETLTLHDQLLSQIGVLREASRQLDPLDEGYDEANAAIVKLRDNEFKPTQAKLIRERGELVTKKLAEESLLEKVSDLWELEEVLKNLHLAKASLIKALTEAFTSWRAANEVPKT